MRKFLGLIVVMVLLTAGYLFINIVSMEAQRLPKAPVGKQAEKQKVMPEVVILAKSLKVGPVRFNHVKHNGGEYNIDGPITCIECHHTAQPAADLISIPPHKTVWPAGRTTTLTAELFAENPNKAGVAACRDCHAREGFKPKLLDAIPVLVDPGTGTVAKMTNQLAFHQACDVCHFQIGFRVSGTKAPSPSNCTSCHKPIAKK